MQLKVPPLVLVICTALMMAASARLIPALRLPFTGSTSLALIIAAGAILICWLGVHDFRRAKTTVNPLQPGNATSLVTAGIYRLSRNPMYLGFLLFLAAWACYLTNLAAMLFLPGFIVYLNKFQIEPEEKALQALFGDAFIDYTHRVRRWL